LHQYRSRIFIGARIPPWYLVARNAEVGCKIGLFNAESTDRHCIGCEHFAEWRAGGAVILCMHEGRPYVQAMPDRGCVHWVRAIGADDEGPIHAGRKARR
jgi:hypothetical protein